MPSFVTPTRYTRTGIENVAEGTEREAAIVAFVPGQSGNTTTGTPTASVSDALREIVSHVGEVN